MIDGDVPITPGELNYAITEACLTYLERGNSRYEALAEIIGTLECAKLEFYRRMLAPYEEIKATQNGDVYDGI